MHFSMYSNHDIVVEKACKETDTVRKVDKTSITTTHVTTTAGKHSFYITFHLHSYYKHVDACTVLRVYCALSAETACQEKRKKVNLKNTKTKFEQDMSDLSPPATF